MKLKGDYNGGTDYSVGDVVRFTDGVPYICIRGCTNIVPHDTRYWQRVGQYMDEAVLLVLDGVEMVNSRIDSLNIPTNINDEAIILKGTGDNEYLITVDDSGETPELSVELIEEEEQNEEESAGD